MRINLKNKHWELGQHFARFVDPRWYPDFILNKENLELFIRWESYGEKSLTLLEKIKIAGLFNGKQNYELTIKMIYQECAEYWSHGFGWYPAIVHTLSTLLKDKPKNKIYIRALIKIARAMKKDFVSAINSYSGFSQEEKNRYLAYKAQ